MPSARASAMELVDIAKYGKYRLESVITKRAGGRHGWSDRWTRSGIGIGGLWYDGTVDGDIPQHSLRANIELLRNGLVVYLRNHEVNYAFVYGNNDITSISLVKAPDILRLHDNTMFLRLLDFGVPYYIAKIILLDHQIEKLQTPILTIHTQDTKLELQVIKKNYTSVAHFVSDIPDINTAVKVEDFTLISPIT